MQRSQLCPAMKPVRVEAGRKILTLGGPNTFYVVEAGTCSVLGETGQVKLAVEQGRKGLGIGQALGEDQKNQRSEMGRCLAKKGSDELATTTCGHQQHKHMFGDHVEVCLSAQICEPIRRPTDQPTLLPTLCA